MLFTTFIGCGVFLLTNVSLLYASHLLVRRFAPESPAAVRLLATGTCFYAFIILIFQALSPFHAISKTWVTIVCLFLSCVFHLLWGTRRDFRAEIEPIRQWIKDGLASRRSVLIIICGFVVLLSFSRALLMPPLAWDCLTYHLTFAALWIKKGTLLAFRAPDQIISCGHLPINGEIFASWLLLPFHSDLLVNIMNFPITFLGGVACYAIARELGLSRGDASWAPPLVCFAPMIYALITTSYVDNAVFAFSLIAVLFALRYLNGRLVKDCLFAFIAAGVVVGVKYNGIIVAVIVFCAVAAKTISTHPSYGFLKKLGICLLGIIIVLALGGRKYILNTIDAGNPLFPFPLKIFSQELLQGWAELSNQEEWLAEYEKEYGLDHLNIVEREYRKLCDLGLTPGPKFAFFLFMALIGFFIRPRYILKQSWIFVAASWVIPMAFYYLETSTNVARGGPWTDGSARYFSSSIALFTIMGLTAVEKLNPHFKSIGFVLVIFVFLDLARANLYHLWEVMVLYPFFAVLIPLAIIVAYRIGVQRRMPSAATILPWPQRVARLAAIVPKRSALTALCGILFVAGSSMLQEFRDTTRYIYYRNHTELHELPRDFVDGWEFLDQKEEKKVIALTAGYKLPNHQWFFYPLLGRRLQNEITYVSAQHKWEVPTWVDGGMLRGTDPEIWFHNLRTKKVDYLFVQEPWPLELRWIESHPDDFQLKFKGPLFRIYNYSGKR